MNSEYLQQNEEFLSADEIVQKYPCCKEIFALLKQVILPYLTLWNFGDDFLSEIKKYIDSSVDWSKVVEQYNEGKDVRALFREMIEKLKFDMFIDDAFDHFKNTRLKKVVEENYNIQYNQAIQDIYTQMEIAFSDELEKHSKIEGVSEKVFEILENPEDF